jgi:hypothetical protein
MKLFDYLMMFKDDVDFDVPDTEIDNVVTVCFSKENAEKISDDFPYMDKFVLKLLKSVDVAYLLSDGTPVCNFSKIIHDNVDKFKEHIRKNWRDDYQWVLDDDTGEFEYEIIKEFHNVVGGNYGESVNKDYYELLESCQISELS